MSISKGVNAGIVTAILLATAVAGYAFGGFYTPGSEGTVVPATATAYLTCYAVDSALELAAGASRPDVLATFKRRSPTGDNLVCFLRVPGPTPQWTATPTPATPEQPACPSVRPGPDWTCRDGGWLPPGR